MPKFDFNVAMDIRAYGTVSIEGETAEDAAKKLTAEYVADNFEPHGGGLDDLDYMHPSDIWLDGTAYNADTGESADVNDFSIPDGPWIKHSPDDPVKLAAHDLLAALESVCALDGITGMAPDMRRRGPVADQARAAIAKAKGGAA